MGKIGGTARAAARRVSQARGADAPVGILGTRVLRTEDTRFLVTGGVYTEDVLAVFTGAGPGRPSVPKTLFTSCDQAIFVDQATYASPPSDAVELKLDLSFSNRPIPGHRIRGDPTETVVSRPVNLLDRPGEHAVWFTGLPYRLQQIAASSEVTRRAAARASPAR
jgi:hypothetical protein